VTFEVSLKGYKCPWTASPISYVDSEIRHDTDGTRCLGRSGRILEWIPAVSGWRAYRRPRRDRSAEVAYDVVGWARVQFCDRTRVIGLIEGGYGLLPMTRLDDAHRYEFRG
jgi:hypothetical protein